MKVGERIGELQALAAHEGPDQQAPDPASVHGLLRFLHLHSGRITSIPSLVLAFEGHVRAEWRRHRADRVAIQFLNGTDVRYVVFQPNTLDPTRTNRVSGSSTVDTFFADTSIEHV